MAPSQVIVDKEPGGAPALNPGIVQAADRRERRIGAAALQNNGERGESLLKIRRPEQALVPRKCRIEVIHKILRKDMGISSSKGVERLGRDRVERGD